MRISDWSSDVCSSDLDAAIDLTTACATLTGWDGLASPASVGYPLFAAWWKQIEEKPGIWKTPFDAATPVTTPRDLKLDDPAVLALLRRALGQAIIDLRHDAIDWTRRSEEHTSELQSLMRISYAVFCLKKKKR